MNTILSAEQTLKWVEEHVSAIRMNVHDTTRFIVTWIDDDGREHTDNVTSLQQLAEYRS